MSNLRRELEWHPCGRPDPEVTIPLIIVHEQWLTSVYVSRDRRTYYRWRVGVFGKSSWEVAHNGF